MLFHDLRRTGVRNLIRAGVSQTVAMTISGHSTPSIFRRYDITSDDDLQDAAVKLQRYADGQDGTNRGTNESEDAGNRSPRRAVTVISSVG
jgi:hypothetical protein